MPPPPRSLSAPHSSPPAHKRPLCRPPPFPPPLRSDFLNQIFTNATAREEAQNALGPSVLQTPQDGEGTLYRKSNELLGLMSFPRLQSSLTIDFSSLIGPLFYTWVVQLAMPSM